LFCKGYILLNILQMSKHYYYIIPQPTQNLMSEQIFTQCIAIELTFTITYTLIQGVSEIRVLILTRERIR
jgi:hypothetical protein